MLRLTTQLDDLLSLFTAHAHDRAVSSFTEMLVKLDHKDSCSGNYEKRARSQVYNLNIINTLCTIEKRELN